MMTRKDFNAIAEVLREHRRLDEGIETQCAHVLHLARAISKVCEEANPRFNQERFMKAVAEE